MPVQNQVIWKSVYGPGPDIGKARVFERLEATLTWEFGKAANGCLNRRREPKCGIYAVARDIFRNASDVIRHVRVPADGCPHVFGLCVIRAAT
jgi:hypothetical protein